jgi:MFS transporter, DHA1 family, multidrug resistance protein
VKKMILSPRGLRGNLIVLASVNFLRGAHSGIHNVIWQPFVLSLGASMPTLGLLNSIGGMSGIVTTVVQSLGGWLADRVGRKPLILASSVALTLGYFLFALAGVLHAWFLLLIGIIFGGISSLARPAMNSITAESVHSERQGSAFSLMQIAILVPGIVAPTLGGAMADRFGYLSVFPLGISLEIIVLAIVWRLLRDTGAPSNGDRSARDAFRVLFRAVAPPKGLRGFFLATALDGFAWGMGWGLLYGLLTDAYGFSAERLGLMSSVMSFSWAVMQFPIGRYIDRRNLKGVMIFSESIGIPLMLIYLTQTRFEMFIVSQVLFGLTAATWVPVISTYLSRSVADQERAEAFGRVAAFRGIVGFPAPLIGGWLYTWGGYHAPFVANLIGVFVVLVILTFYVGEPKKTSMVSNP